MRKTLILLLSGVLLFSGCSTVKGLFSKGASLFGRKKTQELALIGDIETLRVAYQDGRLQALEELIGIYNDSNLPFEVRIAAGEALAETHHPTAVNAIARIVSDADAMDLTFMEASIELLATFRENPKAADALVHAMHTIEEKTNHLHLTLIRNLNKVQSKNQIYALLDIYAAAKANMARTEMLLSETLGALGNDEVVPVLVSLAKDPDINLGIRNQAVIILGKKNPAEVVDAFTELLGDPQTNIEVRDFAINTMAGVKEERLILSLLDTYNTGKKEYFSLLNTLLDALGDFRDPEVKSAMIEIGKSSDYPISLRTRAIVNLGNYGDPSVIRKLLPLLSDAKNYRLQSAITAMIHSLGQEKNFEEELRRLAYQAHREYRIDD